MTSLGIAPVSKKPIEAQAADALRDAIVEGRIAPGSRITETQLAAEMDLSRATVRAALHQLLQEGLTVLIPYTGWTVVALSADDVWELYSLRSALERLAAGVLAVHPQAQRRQRFGVAFEALVQACAQGQAARIAQADFALHKALIDQCGNGRLRTQYETIERQIRLCIGSSDALVESPAAILEQHRPLAEAVLAGDAARAAELAEAHNLTEGAKLREHFARQQPVAEPALRASRGSTRLRNQKRRAPAAAVGDEVS
ncbi:GntR family transcriptional regulator [Pseudaquabacterium rugosum]|uniref:GntR family transcriptional regulator n=1 Tax=Pseudaquabacterium rugosum TaxID=2984194 RepID=A0ABU9B7V3_9BURK